MASWPRTGWSLRHRTPPPPTPLGMRGDKLSPQQGHVLFDSEQDSGSGCLSRGKRPEGLRRSNGALHLHHFPVLHGEMAKSLLWQPQSSPQQGLRARPTLSKGSPEALPSVPWATIRLLFPAAFHFIALINTLYKYPLVYQSACDQCRLNAHIPISLTSYIFK